MIARVSLIILLGVLLSTSEARGQAAEVVFDRSLGVDLATMTRSQSGVYSKVLVEGQGDPAQIGSLLRVEFEAYLPNGTEFGRLPPGETLEFELRERVMIPGFIEGVTGMRPGESRLIIIPPQLGYGERGAPDVPPGSTLVFRVKRVG
jgi:FKBP-type peptidyl-prolyl cis-trans isomerase FkpA